MLYTLPLLGCEVTSEKINTWKQSERGAPKIRAALRDTRQKMPIRIEAAQALAEMGLIQPLLEDLKAISGADRRVVSDGMAKGLIAKMKGSNPKATTRVQLQAKDALFAIREVASPRLRLAVDQELVRWILADYQQRDAGEHSGEKVIIAVGATGGEILVDALRDEEAPLPLLASLLRKVADEKTRDKGGQILVELAKKQSNMSVNMYRALGIVGSTTVLSFLEEIARQGDLDNRVYALRAMSLFPHTQVIPTVHALAADESLKDEAARIRDEAFRVLEMIDDPKSLEILCGFLQDKDEKVMYRASDAIINGFRAEGLTKLLEGLPPGYNFKKLDLEDFIEKPVIGLGPKTLPPLRQALESKNWVARVVAAHILGQVGTKADIPALERLSADTTKIKEWEGGVTVGSEARSAADAISKRQ